MPKQNNNILITFIISLSSICQTLSSSTLSLSQFVSDFSRLPFSAFGEGVGALGLNKRCWSGVEGEFCGDDYGGEIIVVKRLRIANWILVGLLGGSGPMDCGGSVWWAMGFWRWRSVSSCGFQAMEISAFLWVSNSGDQLGFWVSRLVCCGGGLWVMGFGMDRHGGVSRG